MSTGVGGYYVSSTNVLGSIGVWERPQNRQPFILFASGFSLPSSYLSDHRRVMCFTVNWYINRHQGYAEERGWAKYSAIAFAMMYAVNFLAY